MSTSDVWLSVHQRHGEGGVVNVLEARFGPLGGRSAGSFTIEFEHVGREHLDPVPLLDGYVFGVLPLAMQGADRIRVEGPVSTTAIRNAWTLGEVYHSWLPGHYRPVEVVPDRAVDEVSFASRDEPRRTRAAIAAFSGGLDSTFTAFRHANGPIRSGGLQVADLCMVHGFDVGLDNRRDFDRLVARTRPFIDSIGARLHVVRTNLREATQPDWPLAHGMHLSCVLHQFAGTHFHGLIASGDADARIPPRVWGSGPAIDHLMSGSGFLIASDGAGFSRSEKIAALAHDPVARASVKVCWENPRQDLNCGRCLKCIRTQLSFRANGVEHPECFAEPLTSADVATIAPSSAKSLENLKDTLAFARKRGTVDPIFDVLEARINALVQEAMRRDLKALRVTQRDSVPAAPPQDHAGLAERMLAHTAMITEFIRREPPVWLLTEMPGNIGDHLIWAGTERLLSCGGVNHWRMPVGELLATAGRPRSGTLVIPGSGALVRLWHEWLPELVSAASGSFDRVVILPSQYEPAVPVVRAALSHSNVFAFARDAESYGAIKHFGRACLALDPALWAIDFVPATPYCTGDHDLGGMLVALRTDEGSLLPDLGMRPSTANDDISLTAGSLQQFIDVIRAVDTVVTDRLHVTVAAAVLGKRVRFIDPYSSKITRYVRFNFRDEFSDRLEQRDEQWLADRGFVETSRGRP